MALCICQNLENYGASQAALVVKHLPANSGDVRDMRSIPGSGRSSEVGNANLLHDSGLEEFHGQRNYSPWGCKESGMTECMCVRTRTHTQNYRTVNVNLYVNYVL